MDELTEAVLVVNGNFYRALSLADLGAMQRVWLASPDAVCVHPGWPPLRGCPDILESWRGIFAHQGPLHIWPTETEVRLYGQTAEINCLENIDVAQVEQAEVICTRATNIFRRVAVSGDWKMLEHHTVPLPPGHGRRLTPYSVN